ncbi:MAG: T9SS type A sorting domain-containing protein [Ignavibacteriales bacterium]|nr:T9SS type A sorting domain-containing protein [Ignavibacteriales bacterium]
MNLKNLLKISFLLVFLVGFFTSYSQAQTTRYLNVTDGDDQYDGTNPTHTGGLVGPKRTISDCYAKFDDGTIVMTAAGEYYKDQSGIGGGNDADGLQLAGTKSMRFIIQTYNLSNVLYLDGGNGVNRDLTIDVSAGKTITFEAENPGVQSVSTALGPLATAAGMLGYNKIDLQSGSLSLVSLASFDVAASIVNIERTDGSLTGTFAYSAAARIFTYNGAVTPQVTGGELPNTIAGGSIISTRGGGTSLTVANAPFITFTTGGVIQNNGAGAVTFSGQVAVSNNAGALTRILNSLNGTMTFNNNVTFTLQTGNFNPAAGPVVENATNGTLTFLQTLSFVDSKTTAGPGDHLAFVQNTDNGTINVSVVTSTSGGLTATPERVWVSFINDATGPGAGAGVMNVGNSSTASNISMDLINDNGGTVNLLGDLTVGTVPSAGPSQGRLSNANATSLIAVNGNTLKLALDVAAGSHNNLGSVTTTAIGVGLVDFTNTTNLITVNGNGTWPNIRTGGGAVTFLASTQFNGNVTVNGTGNLILTAATSIAGSLFIQNNGNATLTALTTLSGNLTMSGAGDAIFNAGTNATIQGSVTMSGNGALLQSILAPQSMQINGTVNISNAGSIFELRGDVIVFGVFTETNGTVRFTGSPVLNMKNNFFRTTGQFGVNAGLVYNGTLQFSSGGQGQVLSGGPNFKVDNLVVSSVGTGVSLVNGSVEVITTATINANTTMALGTLNIRMVGQAGVFTNGGQYTATGGGGVIFEDPSVGAVPQMQKIGGTGIYSNVEVRMADETHTVDVSAATVVTLSGVLQLTRGGINIPTPAEFFNLSIVIVPVPTIKMNLNDTGVAGTDGKPFVGIPANFNTTNVSYDLEYFGNLTATTPTPPVGTEFQVNRVRNLTIGSLISAGQYVQNTTTKTISGSLNVVPGARFHLNGGNLIANGTAYANQIGGLVSSAANTDILILTGNGSTTGGSGVAQVENMQINSAAGVNDVTDLKVIGKDVAGYRLLVTAGTVNLGMKTTAGNPGDILNYIQNGGVVTLTNNVEFPLAAIQGFSLTAGTFDFANFNVWWSDDGLFSATGGAFAATGVTDKGYLQFRTSASINTSGILVPRIHIDPLKDGGIVTTMTGNTGVSQQLIVGNTDATAGTFTSQLDLNGNTFENKGTIWYHITNQNYGTTGTMQITGPVTLTMFGAAGTGGSVDDYGTVVNPVVPNLVVANAANTFTLIGQTDADGDRMLVVPGAFTFTSGTVNLNSYDIELTGTGGTEFVYTSGSFLSISNKGLGVADIDNGELVFNNASAQQMSAAAGLIIQNLRVEGIGGVTLTGTGNPITVSHRFVFGNGGFSTGATPANDGRLIFGNQAWIERRDGGALNNAPVFPTVTTVGVDGVDIYYAAGGAYNVGKEMPAGTTSVLRDLFVNTDVNASKDITVNRLYNLIAGTYEAMPAATAYAVNMASGTTIDRVNGFLLDNSVTGGPISLIYSNSAVRSTEATEWPATIVVNNLLVHGSANLSYFTTLTLVNRVRAVGDFTMNLNLAATQFDLNGGTLQVTNIASATLTRGTLISSAVSTGGVYIFGTLDVAGNLTSTANVTVTNVNVHAGTATLNGTFNSVDLDGVGPNVLSGVTIANIDHDASFGTFSGDANVGFLDPLVPGNAILNGVYTGNLAVAGNTTVNNTYQGGTLNAYGNLTLTSPSGNFGAAVNLLFSGRNDQNFVLWTSDGVNNLTMNKALQTPHSGRVVMPNAAATLTVGTLYLYDGLLVTNNNSVFLGTQIQGFIHNPAVGRFSHVVGNVSKYIPQGSGDPVFGPGPTRFEYPVGSDTNLTRQRHPDWRPATIQFNTAYTAQDNIYITVNHMDVLSSGLDGLPIDDGTGNSIGSFAPYYWKVTSMPYSLGPAQKFDLELVGTNMSRSFLDYNKLRAIRRYDGNVADNKWYMQGTASNYANLMQLDYPLPGDTTITLRVLGASTGTNGQIIPQGTRFTIGIPSIAPFFVQPYKKGTANPDTSLTVNENQALAFNFIARQTDLLRGGIAFATVGAPAGAVFTTLNSVHSDNDTLAMAWTPTYTDAGVYNFIVKASLGGMSDSIKVRVTVVNANRAPEFTAKLGNVSIANDSVFTFKYIATDADAGDVLTYSLISVTPAFAGTKSINATSGDLTLTPAFADAGKTFSVVVNVTDNVAIVTATPNGQVTVTYKRLKGDVDGNGAVQAIDASLILQHVVGLITITDPQSLWAAEVTGDGNVGALDASYVLYYVVNGHFPTLLKSVSVNGDVSFGQLEGQVGTDVVRVPVKLSNSNNVLSAQVTLDIDNKLVDVESVKGSLPEGWQMLYNYANGKLNIAMCGISPLADGNVAVIALKLKDKEARVSVSGTSNLNDALQKNLSALSVRQIPAQFELSQNYPNPFNPNTKIKYSLAFDSRVTLTIYNLLGQKVKTLFNGQQEAGFYTMEWNGTNEYGQQISSGMYIYRIEAGSFVSTKKMNLLK